MYSTSSKADLTVARKAPRHDRHWRHGFGIRPTDEGLDTITALLKIADQRNFFVVDATLPSDQVVAIVLEHLAAAHCPPTFGER
ncbi:MAG TPA: hypothetical protein DGG94_16740 [Micromonosporaceae bacterium]|nr:hypothetical protein [Micromonosporaceae bacterium]HCU51419.1 hypothetical protein [Micromonosporaceae bacterium]